MKLIFSIISVIYFSYAEAKEIYIGSTPATNTTVRSFLGIPIADSVDFIKWKLVIARDDYFLQYQYGISKPNTDGFINDGKKVELKGKITKDKNYYFLHSENKTLGVLQLNNNLLHFLNPDKSLLKGNGGWSYTINKENASSTDQVNILSKQLSLKDSFAFEGRTPCWNFGLIHPSPACIKMKWYVVLYADPKTNKPTTYHLNGNNRREGGVRGSWQIIRGKDGRIIYQLGSDKDSIYLLKFDENILVFTDVTGNLLVGDKNFSFTLSKRW